MSSPFFSLKTLPSLNFRQAEPCYLYASSSAPCDNIYPRRSRFSAAMRFIKDILKIHVYVTGRWGGRRMTTDSPAAGAGTGPCALSMLFLVYALNGMDQILHRDVIHDVLNSRFDCDYRVWVGLVGAMTDREEFDDPTVQMDLHTAL